METEDIQNIIKSISTESKNFFINDMQLEIISQCDIPTCLPTDHFTFIKLSSDLSFVVCFDIDEKLFNVLFDKFFVDGVEDDEKDELVDALPDEIINIVVGLAIRAFPVDYNESELGLPMKLDKNQITELYKSGTPYSHQITTNKGKLTFSII